MKGLIAGLLVCGVFAMLGYGMLVLGSGVQLSSVTPLSPIPGFEGLNAGIEGVEVQGRYYKLGATLPTGYRWISTGTRSAVVAGDLTWIDTEGAVAIEAGDPQVVSDPFTTPKEIDYWVKEGTTYIHVKGQIIAYTAHVTLNVRDTGMNNVYKFSGEKVWFSLAGLTWNRAAQEQGYTGTTVMGSAWEAPLQAVIQSYSVNDLGDHYYLEPREQGRSITLYTGTSQSGTLSDLMSGDVNATFAGDVRPDTRLRNCVYFPIVMTDFGETVTIWGDYTPTADYTLKVYTLRLGRFTYTNIDDTPWGNRLPEDNQGDQFWKNLGANLQGLSASPWFWIGLVAIVAVVLFIVALPYIGTALVMGARR